MTKEQRIIWTRAAAHAEYANRQYHRARRRHLIMAAGLNNSDMFGTPSLSGNAHYFFETMWDENWALWIDAQQQAIGWASR